jgi:hypothetical protein
MTDVMIWCLKRDREEVLVEGRVEVEVEAGGRSKVRSSGS